jgi:sugar phosphate isomerase/epimerase
MSCLGAAMDVRFAVSVPEFLEYITGLGLNHLELKREYLEGHPDAPDAKRLGDLAAEYDITVTLHAPFRDWNMGSFNERARRDSVERIKRTIDDARTVDARAVVIHGGSVQKRYPEWVRKRSADHTRQSLAECAEYAQMVGVPLCLENQPPSQDLNRYTTTPSDIEAALSAVDVSPKYLGVTLDVGHAKLAGVDWQTFVDRFGDRIQVCHLHDNSGEADNHEPLSDYQHIVDQVPAEQFVFEMKTVEDVAKCVDATDVPPQPALTTDD